MRAADDAFAPRALEHTLLVEDDHRMRAAIEDPHIVVGVHGDRRRLDEAPAIGQLPPTHYRRVAHARASSLTVETRPYTATRS